MIQADNPHDWWEKAKKAITEPIEWEEDNQGNEYCPIENVIERINQIFGPFWNVKIHSREYEERTSEAIIDATVVFRTPGGLPNITKDVIGRDDAVRPKYDRNNNKVDKYEDRPIRSIGDVYAGARSNAIKRAAKDLEIALKMTFSNPALDDQRPDKNNGSNQKGDNNSNQSSNDLDRDKLLDKIEKVRKERKFDIGEAKTMMVNTIGKAGTKDCSTKQLQEFLEVLEKKRCEECREEISKKVVSFCESNEDRFENKILCMECQKSY